MKIFLIALCIILITISFALWHKKEVIEPVNEEMSDLTIDDIIN